MTKDVWIKLSGLQLMDQDGTEPVEVITTGEYYNRNGTHYILFEEVMEGFDEVTKTRIKCSEDGVEITKKGVANVTMVFRSGVMHMANYQTPFGPLVLGMEGQKLVIEESEDQLEIYMEYILEVDETHLADCQMRINVKSKSAGAFPISG